MHGNSVVKKCTALVRYFTLTVPRWSLPDGEYIVGEGKEGAMD